MHKQQIPTSDSFTAIKSVLIHTASNEELGKGLEMKPTLYGTQCIEQDAIVHYTIIISLHFQAS